jgi:hypothetical protein
MELRVSWAALRGKNAIDFPASENAPAAVFESSKGEAANRDAMQSFSTWLPTAANMRRTW